MIITGYKILLSPRSEAACAEEYEMKELLYENCPLAAVFNGNCLQSYNCGIIDLTSIRCLSDGINHAVLIVG